jgi:protoheme ferro-lyase
MKGKFDIAYFLLMLLGFAVGILSTVCIMSENIVQIISIALICIFLLVTLYYLLKIRKKLWLIIFFILLMITGYLISCIYVNLFMGRVEVGEIDPSQQKEGTAVLLLSPGEIKEYSPNGAVYRLKAYRDTCVSNVSWWNIPLKVRGLKEGIKGIEGNTFPAENQSLYNKVSECYGEKYKVYNANLFGPPYLETVTKEILKDGYKRIIVLSNLLIQQPYKEVVDSKILKIIGERRLEAEVLFTFPLWNHDGLVSLYESRILEKTQENDPEQVGVILVARGYSKKNYEKFREAFKREEVFMNKIKESIVKNGYDGRKVRTAHLRYREPGLEEAVDYIMDSGVSKLVVVAAGYENSCIDTEYVIPEMLKAIKLPSGVETVYIGPWGDSDLLVKALGDRLKMVDTRGE